jgi:hypothetical protein
MLSSSAEQRLNELEDLVAEVLKLQGETQRELNLLMIESREFRRETRAFKSESNKRWGELANKMGTLAEDIAAPSLPRIARQVAGRPEPEVLEFFGVRVKPRHASDPSRSQEFDVVAVCGDYLLLNETKSRLEPSDVKDFVEILQEARAFFPHYADKKVIGALASLYVDESVVRAGEKAGLLVLGMGEELMDVLNTPGFVPREF